MVLVAAGGAGEYVALCQLQRSHRLHFSLSIVAYAGYGNVGDHVFRRIEVG